MQTARPDGRPNTSRDHKVPLPAGPGPGSYNHPVFFPKGPNARIETKKRRDSLFLNTIDRTVSPGPAAHTSLDAPINAGVGSKVIKFGDTKRFAKNQPGSFEFSYTNAGPGEYSTNHVNNLKR